MGVTIHSLESALGNKQWKIYCVIFVRKRDKLDHIKKDVRTFPLCHWSSRIYLVRGRVLQIKWGSCVERKNS